MSLRLGSTVIAGIGTNTKYNANNLLDWKWTDHELNDQSWLKADTFSWQDGTAYSDVYNHLVADNSSGTSQTETVGSYTISYKLAPDGHKITTDESTVANIYNETGVAWYYVLDTTNQRFKLPRENPEREVLGQSAAVIGNGMTLGMTNGTTNFAMSGKSGTSGTNNIWSTSGYGQAVSSTPGTGLGYQGIMGVTTDPTKSGMIAQLSETTGIYKGKKYLYFYVGEYSQTATEQTAGLNSSLFNDKVDLDGNNATFPHVIESYENGSSWYRVYSDGWCEQGGITGTESTTRGQTINISFMMQFNDTNYTIIATDGNTSKTTYSSSVGIASILNGTKTTSDVSISSYGFASADTHGVISWIAYGKVF